MERFTKQDEHGNYLVSMEKVSFNASVCSGVAIDRLGRFEDFYEAMKADMEQIPQELEKMRAAGRDKSYRYKELMGKKLTVAYIVNLLKDFGL